MRQISMERLTKYFLFRFFHVRAAKAWGANHGVLGAGGAGLRDGTRDL